MKKETLKLIWNHTDDTLFHFWEWENKYSNGGYFDTGSARYVRSASLEEGDEVELEINDGIWDVHIRTENGGDAFYFTSASEE